MLIRSYGGANPLEMRKIRGSILFPQPTSICPRFVQSHVNDIRTQADFVTVETKKNEFHMDMA
jgi:hypothetical protein